MDDLPNLVKNANNINVWNNLRNYFPHPYTEEHAKSWIESAMMESPAMNFAIDMDCMDLFERRQNKRCENFISKSIINKARRCFMP